MAGTWVGIVNAAAAETIKGAVDTTVRKRLIPALLEQRGKMRTGVDGSYETLYDLDWKEPPVSGLAYGTTATYEPRDYLKQATMRWRGAKTTDAMHIVEFETMKHSTQKLVDRYARIFPKLTAAVRRTIGEKIYVDGDAAGNEDMFEGLETFLTAGGTCGAADIIAVPDDSYHGLDTDLHQSGTWTSDLTVKPNAAFGYDWPEGSGDPEFDYHSPKLVNWSSTGWGTGQTSWESNCARVIRRTAQWMRVTCGIETSRLVCMLNASMLTDFRNNQEAKTRILAPHPESLALGFGDGLTFEGVELLTEYKVPVNTGYFLNFDDPDFQLMFTTDDMIVTRGPNWSDAAMAFLFLVYSIGNYRFNPRNVAKLKNYA